MAGQHEEHDQPGDRARRREQAARSSPARTAAGSPRTAMPGRRASTKTPNSSSTVTRSSSRSRMIVAKAAVARQPLRGAPAGTAGALRPARAGSRKLAAKPMTVVRNAVAETGRPDRRQQVLPAERAQRVGEHVTHDARAAAAGRRRGVFRPRRRPCPHCGEKRQQPDRQQRGRGPREVETACKRYSRD